MKCPRCQQENPPQARFCMGCAAGLTPTCARCSTELPGGAAFCFSCGLPVRAAAHAQRFGSLETYTPKHLAEKILTSKTALEGERKQVTVLFADMKGSMEFLADRDPEEARKILDPVLELMMDAVHHYEGTVNQVMGDGIMALFGAPLAHEDHAVRACYAALRMQESVKRYAERLQRTAGIPVQIRVGLNSGEVVVRSIRNDLHMDYTAVGQTTHLAARMEQMAMAGSILLSADVFRLAEGFVQVKPLGAVAVKGLSEPVEAYELIGAGAARTRLQVSVARGLSRFVGRDPEIDTLRRAIEKAGRSHGQVVGVVGEPGVGKSRLFWEFTHSHRTHGWLVLDSGSVSYGKATPYLPVIDLLKTYFKIQDRDGHREVREKVTGKLLTLDRALEPTLPAFLALLDVPEPDPAWQALEPPQRRQRTLEAVKRLLLRESQVQPSLVIFEDLHWIDGETQALLDSLIESLPAARALLLVNYRPEYQHAWGSKTYYSQLRLDALPPESAGELLVGLLGKDPGLEPLKQVLITRTGGNPFFLEESVRTLVETRVLAGERAAYRLEKPLARVQVPASVRAVLAARIDRLPVDEKQLLQSAAVIGNDVPFPILQGIVELPEDALRHGVAHLQSAEFLYETSLFPDLEYTFKHALTHEVAYSGLLHERRRALHARVVETIEAHFADRLAEHVEQLAHHSFRGEIWHKALRYMRQAGQKAASRSAHREAVACFDQALAALGHLPDGREGRELAIALRLEIRSSLFTSGELARIPEVLGEVETIATAIGDHRRLAIALAFLANHYFEMAEAVLAGKYAERSLRVARHLGDPGLEALATYHLGRNLYSVGEYCPAIDLLVTAVATLQEHPIEILGEHATAVPGCLTFLSRALIEVGQFAQAVARAEEALQVSEAANFALGSVHAHFALGFAHLNKGDLARAIPPLERGLGLARTKAVSFLEPLMCAAVGSAYARSGQITEGLVLLEEGVRGATRMGHLGFLLRLQGWLAEGYLLAERRAEAISVARQSLDATRRTGQRGREAHVLRVLADAAAGAKPPEVKEAAGRYQAALTIASELGMRPLVAHCHLGLGGLCRRTGNSEQVQEHLTTATTMYREMDMRYWLEQAEAEMREFAGNTE